MVTEIDPQYIGTLFWDPKSEQEVESLGEQVKSRWRSFLAERQAEYDAANAPSPPDVSPTSAKAYDIVLRYNESPKPPPLDLNQVFEEFTQSVEMVALKADLDRACYWRSGDYSFTLTLVTDRPEKKFAHPGSFSLSESDVQNLRGNIDAMLRTWCNVPIPYTVQLAPTIAYTLTRP
jgi:hypothetical protein